MVIPRRRQYQVNGKWSFPTFPDPTITWNREILIKLLSPMERIVNTRTLMRRTKYFPESSKNKVIPARLKMAFR